MVKHLNQAFLALSLVGCSRTLSQSYMQALAAHQIQCPKEQVRVVERGRNLFDAEGCGKKEAVRCSQSACANLTTLAMDRFASEYSCAVGESRATEISPLVFKVEGCAKAANYVCDMQNSLARCVAEAPCGR